ncbi:uncharacterized protein [Prorops nasuta]|uniref:uncharacterized protein n=1 Tax=Prorops nasuta TaxID=863751 RepID=UPI0034CEA6A1
MIFSITVLLLLPFIAGLPTIIKIGALFDGDDMIEHAFETSVRAVNRNRNRTTSMDTPEIILISKSERVNGNLLDVADKACNLVRSGITGIFGPQSKNSINYVQSFCDTKDIPCINVGWYPEEMPERVVNLYPRAETLSRFKYDLINYFNWTSYAILYQGMERLTRMSYLMGTNTFYHSHVAFHELGKDPDFRDVLENVRDDGHENIVLDCSIEILVDILDQALQLDLLTDRHKWLITSLEFSSLHLDVYRDMDVTFVGARLINPNDSYVKKIFEENFYDWDLKSPDDLKTEAALMFDAVQLFVQGFLHLKESTQESVIRLSCNDSDSWQHGTSLSNLIRSETLRGITGNITFNPQGFREDFQLDVISIRKNETKTIGIWHSEAGIKRISDESPGMMDMQKLRNKNIIVAISITKPFAMYVATSRTKFGNDRYEGFVIDIIYELSKMLGFNYTFQVQEDNVYGSIDPYTEEWDGMIQRIREGKADLAITDLTINENRARVVDFTAPFMNLGVSVLYRIPQKAPPSLFAFTTPFSKEVWISLIVAYIGVSVILFLAGRFNPREWYNPFPCIKKPTKLYNKFTLVDTPFFVLGSILWNNTDFVAKGISTRGIATSWWFFCLLIANSYTANLVAFLTMQSIEWPFQRAAQLADQSNIKYGAKDTGSALHFFKNSNDENYMKMYNYMLKNKEEVLVRSNDEGLQKVISENYAFFMESPSIDYFRERYCNITQIGDLLTERSYAIAMTKDAAYRQELSTALLKLQEDTVINELHIKWWKKKRGGGKCPKNEPPQVTPLEMKDVYGIFFVLFTIVIFSFLYTILEFIIYVRKNPRRDKGSFIAELTSELKYRIKLKTIKPVSKKERNIHAGNTSTTMVHSVTKNFYKAFLLIIYICQPCFGFRKKIPIGGLFDDELIQKSFEAAVRAVNNNGLTFEGTADIQLIPKLEEVNGDVYEVSRKACNLTKLGVTGIFAPQGKEANIYLQSMCENLDIPCISTRWFPDQIRKNFISLYPQADMIFAVIEEIIRIYGWKSYAILYQNSDKLILANRLLSLSRNANSTIALYNLGLGPDFREILLEIKKNEHENIVIDCSFDILPKVLLQGQQIGLTSGKHNWIIASLDFTTLDFDRYRYSGVNITGLSLINRNDRRPKEIFENYFNHLDVKDVSHLRADAALMFDAVVLFAQGFARLKNIVAGSVKRLSCKRNDTWYHGESLSNLIKSEKIFGLTGNVIFGPTGYRTELHLDILGLVKEGLTKIGQWDSKNGYEWSFPEKPVDTETKILKDLHFTVLISLNEPYAMYVGSSKSVSGNARYEGFTIDIIKELSKILGFNYTFRVQEDNRYGNLINNEWDGMIKKLLENETDLAITDLTINKERSSVVDFTAPFMNLGISILYRIPQKAPPSLVSFLNPFSANVWITLFISYIVTSLLFFVLGRLNPKEWSNQNPCINQPDSLVNEFSLNNSFTATIGSLLQQDTVVTAKGSSTRAICTFWWFFALLITSTYIANLTASLAAKDNIWVFKNVRQLISHSEIKYGAKRGGATLNYFKHMVNESDYQTMYRTMRDYDSEIMEDNNEAGLRRVMHENYAFFMESTSIEYYVQRFCNVTQIGGILNEESYGIAMRKDAKYRNNLTIALLYLNENAIINQLKLKWWTAKRGGDKCVEKYTNKAAPLDLQDVGGVFLFFLIGMIISVFLTILEFLLHVLKISQKRKVSFYKQLGVELKFLRSGLKRRPVKDFNPVETNLLEK